MTENVDDVFCRIGELRGRIDELDRDRLKRDAPYRMQVYRRRKDFKKVQAEVAPGIENKGQAFAEGVAGFYSQGHKCIFMWDAEGMQGATQLEVAKHETTHLLNSLLARQIAINVPTWFEEGAATYFSMAIALPGGNVPEPRDHAGALAEVVGEIESGKPYTGRGIRSVSCAWLNTSMPKASPATSRVSRQLLTGIGGWMLVRMIFPTTHWGSRTVR